ncbi:type IX secretion system protein PorQ [Neolewinella lacunae]|uniref:Type IX secretion system protein PorQ n=1 Tax=Neolewinella lacunae TaxID=1517758 RepID=A0A923PNB2_9BACT|nr:type IX secretion system protein PorQ [Neolewinella lacunae]MBC6995570.1 type IX secretion system protein PorQ [Neolewinella lacunae]MDN3635606.1 type IX secretion system protein PorQ [Neolewinella lacunae]
MRILSFFLWLCLTAPLTAQVGGISAYEFLNLPNSATIAAMGGHHIALMDDDLSLALRNPSLLNHRMDRRAALSHAFHPAGISNSSLAYGHYRESIKTTFQVGLQYVDYGGDLVRRDNTGTVQGSFSASDYALTIGAGHQIEDRLSLGANLKVVSSQLAGYGSIGLATDLAVHYQDTSGRFGISLLARNAGRQLSTYDELSGREPLPFELQLGINRELRYLPFRFSLIYRYLDRWNILYDDPDAENTSLTLGPDDQLAERGAGAVFLDNLARHFVFNGELLIGKARNFRLRFGYNHGLRRELRLVDFRSGAGYSFGFAFRTKRFSLAYGRSTYHLGGGINQLGLDIGFGQR